MKASRNGAGRARKSAGERAPSAAGFTLIEASIAMLILMVAGLSAISLFSFAMKYNTVATDRATVLGILQQRLERARAVPFNDASLSPGTNHLGPCTTVPDPCIKVMGHDYEVWETVSLDTATLKRITIQVKPYRGDALGAGSSVTGTTLRSVITLGPFAQ